ncbi:MAG: phosphoglucosamine mutase [Microthrixaceae bacterium]
MLKFGTDGVRGVANLDLTPEIVLALGRAAARVLPSGRFVVGRDTRRSGPLLEAALIAGLTAEGVDVVRLGVAPTPAVAWVAASEGIAGAVISASHNPFEDNGVKLFLPGGTKLDDATEDALESALHGLLRHEITGAPRTGGLVGTVLDGADHSRRWVLSVAASIEGRRLEGLRVVVDCANGAGSAFAPDLLRAVGAEVDVLHDRPDGTNINAGCGSTHTDDLQRAVTARGADVGIALDGDADRAVAVDAAGRIIDGDQIIAITAIDRHHAGTLVDNTVVVTVMTNLGFRIGMADHGITVHEVPVGDRFVLEALAKGGFSLGGEQSGHVIFTDRATTGDGLLTALQLFDVVARTGRPLAELADAAMTRLPQVLRNVRVDRRPEEVVGLLADEVAAAEAELGDHGRVLLRGSGTEPLVRVMVEAPTAGEAEHVADRLVAAVAGLG